eukprot:Rhum_TRINITY_DN14387_c22_g1::Rhum_TRINITY_DN14387_c22_g1_i1::g.87086::m.87086
MRVQEKEPHTWRGHTTEATGTKKTIVGITREKKKKKKEGITKGKETPAVFTPLAQPSHRLHRVCRRAAPFRRPLRLTPRSSGGTLRRLAGSFRTAFAVVVEAWVQRRRRRLREHRVLRRAMPGSGRRGADNLLASVFLGAARHAARRQRRCSDPPSAAAAGPGATGLLPRLRLSRPRPAAVASPTRRGRLPSPAPRLVVVAAAVLRGAALRRRSVRARAAVRRGVVLGVRAAVAVTVAIVDVVVVVLGLRPPPPPPPLLLLLRLARRTLLPPQARTPRALPVPRGARGAAEGNDAAAHAGERRRAQRLAPRERGYGDGADDQEGAAQPEHARRAAAEGAALTVAPAAPAAPAALASASVLLVGEL